jgi:hypothetical protein
MTVLSREIIRRKRNMFELKKEKVEIKNQSGTVDVYEIGPLPGKYLADLYSVMEAFQGAQGEGKEHAILKILSTDTSTKLHRMVFASLERSYPDIDKTLLDSFVSVNLLKFMEAIVKVNMPKEN